MTLTTLHVLTRGRAPEHDYRWVAVEPAPHPSRQERPPRLDARAAQLVQSDTPSLLLLRVGGELVLFVTALASGRSDVQGRDIRSAFVLTASEEEQDILRGLAAYALREQGREVLARLVDGAVQDTPEGSFDVRHQLLDELVGLTAAIADDEAEPRRRLGPNDEKAREALADELTNTTLPPGEGPLVVVTGALGAERLEASGAWRGLSRLVSAPFERPPPEVRPAPKKGRAAARWWTILAAAALILILMSLWPLPTP